LDVAAVAPHPDDLEILCGGTLAKLVKQGYRVGIFDLTSGEPTPRGSLETRRAEAEEARRILGVQVRVNVELPNRVLMDGPEARYALATQFRKYRPAIVMIASGRTPAASPDHLQGGLIGEASRFYSQLTKWNERFGGTEPYRVPHLVYIPFGFDAEQRHWHSQFVVDVSDTIDQKIAAVKAYASQFDPGRFARVEHMIRSTNGFHGARCGYMYGELFALPTPVGAPDLVQLVHGSKGSLAPVHLPAVGVVSGAG
jgi:bacillithiol biosynthesis deacetylase BshB1